MLHFNNNLETPGLLCGLKSTVSTSEEKRGMNLEGGLLDLSYRKILKV